MTKRIRLIPHYLLIFLTIIVSGCGEKKSIKKSIVILPFLNVDVRINDSLPRIDGFGVNITPAQWRGGNLKPVLDLLTDDLGSVLYRFDCTGLANWLDPGKRLSDGTWPESYLDSVYRSKVFTDAWETFRYLNSKNIEPFFNVSGRIHPGLGTPGTPFDLKDFEGYAEMIATMLHWARTRENLKFTLLAPFNETDLGYPEGPGIRSGNDMLEATRAIIRKLDQYGLSDVNIIAVDDGTPDLEKLKAILKDSTITGRVKAFATHTYGNGDIGENEGWFGSETNYAKFSKSIKNSAFKNSSVWMSEYGDLDQTELIEYEFAWRSARRLMKSLRDGFNAALAWDAFDNFHEHDTAWAVYGLLRTDTTRWKYTPKKRYYAAKQIYRYVKPGWRMAQLIPESQPGFDVYRTWHDNFRHIYMAAFISADRKDFSIILMNNIESEVAISINMADLDLENTDQVLNQFVTDRFTDCKSENGPLVKGNVIKALLKEKSITTITTLQ